MDFVHHIDLGILKWLNGFVGHSEAFDSFVGIIAHTPLFKGVVMVGLFWGIWFQRRSKPPTETEGGSEVFVVRSMMAALIAIALGRALQWSLPYRPSPMNNAALGLVPASGSTDTFALTSFPSDHAILFFALATGVWLWSRRLGAFAYLWALIVICLPRVYIGRHYASDILAGALIGIALMLVAHRFHLFRRTARVAVRWERLHPASFYVMAFFVSHEIATLFYGVRQVGGSVVALMGWPALGR